MANRDLTGEINRYGVIALQRTGKVSGDRYVYILLCPNCGNTYESSTFSTSKGCGCQKKKRAIDHSGETLLSGVKVLRRTEETKIYRNRHNALYEMLCPCGNIFKAIYKQSLVSCGQHHKPILGDYRHDLKPKTAIVFDTNIGQIISDNISVNNKSGEKGVSWDKTHNKWIVKISFQKRQYLIKRCEKFEEAAEIAKKCFGMRKELLSRYTSLSTEEKEAVSVSPRETQKLRAEFERKLQIIKKHVNF